MAKLSRIMVSDHFFVAGKAFGGDGTPGTDLADVASTFDRCIHI